MRAGTRSTKHENQTAIFRGEEEMEKVSCHDIGSLKGCII